MGGKLDIAERIAGRRIAQAVTPKQIQDAKNLIALVESGAKTCQLELGKLEAYLNTPLSNPKVTHDHAHDLNIDARMVGYRAKKFEDLINQMLRQAIAIAYAGT